MFMSRSTTGAEAIFMQIFNHTHKYRKSFNRWLWGGRPRNLKWFCILKIWI